MRQKPQKIKDDLKSLSINSKTELSKFILHCLSEDKSKETSPNYSYENKKNVFLENYEIEIVEKPEGKYTICSNPSCKKALTKKQEENIVFQNVPLNIKESFCCKDCKINYIRSIQK